MLLIYVWYQRVHFRNRNIELPMASRIITHADAVSESVELSVRRSQFQMRLVCLVRANRTFSPLFQLFWSFCWLTQCSNRFGGSRKIVSWKSHSIWNSFPKPVMCHTKWQRWENQRNEMKWNVNKKKMGKNDERTFTFNSIWSRYCCTVHRMDNAS